MQQPRSSDGESGVLPCSEDEEGKMGSVIAEWYANQNVLVTGATGFMGKILVEKILQSCPKVNTLYVLVRPKRGKDPKQRLQEFLTSPVFDRVKKLPNGTEILKKLYCVSGDVTQKNCGLSLEDQSLLKDDVSVIFHMAANVRFDQTLKNATLFNVGGTLNVLEMACDFQKLKAFLYISTTYCHCDETELKEKLYTAPHDPRHILDLAKWMDEDLLETLTPKLLKNSPNTYAYTKCLTEQLVSEYSDRLPIAIARPSIVTACYKEPIPGWVDNLNGPTGILIGAGKGVIRTMLCNTELNADILPVDTCINSLLIIAWKIGAQPRRDEVDVYNVTSSKEHPLSWGEALELGRKHVFQYPFSMCLWYPGGSPKTNYLAHIMAVFLFHLIPAYFVDFILTLTRNKPFLVRTQKRIQNGLNVLQYYTMRPWMFHNSKLKEVCEGLKETDKKLFYIDWEKFNPDEYMLNYVLGARKYCAHEELDTLPKARKVLKRLYYMDLLKNILLACLSAWLLFYFAAKFLNIFEHPLQFLEETYFRSHQSISKKI